jgi:hypothetical protein
VLGSDSLIFVPHDSSKYDASNPTGYITGAAVPVGSGSIPTMDGTAAAGVSGSWARGDHVHPTDTSRAPIKGVIDASNAAAGNVGEVLSVQITTAVNLTLGTPINIGQLPLTPGDWVVAGNVNFASPGTAGTRYAVAISNTANTLPTPAQLAAGVGSLFDMSLTYGKAAQNFNTSLCRFNVSANTTVYLVALGPATTATGYMSARRVR